MSALSELSPYLVLILVGFLPTEIWRMLGLVVARGLDQETELVVWVRAVAIAVLAGVIGKLIMVPPGALAAVPLAVRLAAIACGLVAFLLVRRLSRVGYSIGWGRRWGLYILGSFLLFGAIAIPLGTAMHFIEFAPRWAEWKSLPLLSLAILLFTAWPEEFLFRGLLQNMLARSTKSELAGWWTASMLFGFSHITNLGFPNWRYVILASIAGLAIGLVSGMVHRILSALSSRC